MNFTARWTLSILIFAIWNISICGAVMCYACEQVTSQYACSQDSLDVVKDRFRGDPGIYTRNCSKMNEYMCSIERIMNAEGVTISFIRDCTDGVTFSYSSKEIPLLRKIKPNNETVCAYYNGQVICITVCLTNYCNGPQGPFEFSGSSISRGYQLLPLVVLFLVTSSFMRCVSLT